MSMDLQEENKGEATIFSLAGRLDSATAPSVEEKILNRFEKMVPTTSSSTSLCLTTFRVPESVF